MSNNRIQSTTIQRDVYNHIQTRAVAYYATCQQCRVQGQCYIQAVTLNSHLDNEAKNGRTNQNIIEDAALMSYYDTRYWQQPYFNLFIRCRQCRQNTVMAVDSHKLMTSDEFQALIEANQVGYLNRVHYGSPTTLFVV